MTAFPNVYLVFIIYTEGSSESNAIYRKLLSVLTINILPLVITDFIKSVFHENMWDSVF